MQRFLVALSLLAVGCSSTSTTPQVDAGSTTPQVDAGSTTPHVDAGCQKHLDCACPTPLCDLDTGICREWGTDAGGVVYRTNRFGNGGESCAVPELLPIWRPGDVATVRGHGLICRQGCQPPPTDDDRGSCSRVGLKDSIFLIRLCGRRNIVVNVPTGPGIASTGVYLRRGTCQGLELICSNQIAAGFTLTDMPPDDYYFFMDGWEGTVKLEDPGCQNPLPLQLDAGAKTFNLESAGSDEADLFTSCGGTWQTSARPDLVFQFTIQASTTFHARAAGCLPGTFDRSFCTPRLALFKGDCAPASRVACSEQNAPDGVAGVNSVLDPGTYLLVLEERIYPELTLEAWLGP